MQRLIALQKSAVLRLAMIALIIAVLPTESSYAQSDSSQGIVHRVETSTCMDSCSLFYLQPDSGFHFTYLKGKLDEYVALHVRVVGVRVWCVECGGLQVSKVIALPPTSIGSGEDQIPLSIYSLQNYPNPFNPSTKISFSIPAAVHVRLTVHNILGQEVATLLNADQTAGLHTVEFTPTNLASGVYFYRLQAGSFVETKKLLLLR